MTQNINTLFTISYQDKLVPRVEFIFILNNIVDNGNQNKQAYSN